MIRVLALGVFLLAARYTSAQIAPPPPQPPRPVVQAASAAESSEQAAKFALLEKKLAERDRLQSEIEGLQKAAGLPQQIVVRIQVVELSLTKMRQLGFDVATAGRADATMSKILEQLALKPTAPTAEFQVVEDASEFQGVIGALTENRLGSVLAEPSIVVVSGRPAFFNVGGELPIPAAPDGKKAIEPLHYGTKVDVIAEARGNNRVRLDLRIRISKPDYRHTIEVANSRVPTLKVKECDTAYELALGQSAVITGFVEQRTEAIVSDTGQREEPQEIGLMFIATPLNGG
jgi:pilus assembly protein CpaC